MSNLQIYFLQKIQLRVIPDKVQKYSVLLGRHLKEVLDIRYTRIGHDIRFMNTNSELLEENKLPGAAKCVWMMYISLHTNAII